MNAADVLTKVETEAKAKATAEPVKYGPLAIGDYHRQGDIYIQRLEMVPAAATVIKGRLQLAPGTTQGSRHCLDSLKGIKLHEKRDATALDGPIVESKRQFTIEHPEHGHVTLQAGVYAITYQRQYAEELRRVAD